MNTKPEPPKHDYGTQNMDCPICHKHILACRCKVHVTLRHNENTVHISKEATK